MNLLLIRHAAAEPRAEEGGTQSDDGLRSLTPKGRRKMRRAARGLAAVAPRIDLLAASPLVRAQQTAEIVAETFDALQPTSVSELQPSAGVDPALVWLRKLDPTHTVAAVGHEPGLGVLASYLLCGRKEPILLFKKGGACLLAIPPGIMPGTATLTWALTPRLLRKLGR